MIEYDVATVRTLMHLGIRQGRDITAWLKGAERAGPARVNDALWYALAIEALQFLDEMRVLQEHRARWARGLRVLIVADRPAAVGRQMAFFCCSGVDARTRRR